MEPALKIPAAREPTAGEQPKKSRFLKKNVDFYDFYRKMVGPFAGLGKFLAVFYAKVALFCPDLADYETLRKDFRRPGARAKSGEC